MSILDSFREMSQCINDPEESFSSMADYKPTYTEAVIPPTGWEEDFKNFRTYPSLYNLDGYISSQPYLDWGNSSPIISQIAEDARAMMPHADKIDTNKVFASEIQSLRKISTDQSRIIKMFEKKFTEMITEKGKYGITEEDVLAFQALVQARAQLTANTKEQVAIKKNIAELKIKQNQALAKSAGLPGSLDTDNKATASADVVGRSILDNIFSAQLPSADAMAPPPSLGYTSVSPTDASSILDDLLPSTKVSNHIQYESLNPKTYVVVDSDGSAEYQTFSDTGELIPDYPNPTTRITAIDKDLGRATDELLVSYDIKFRDEL